MPHDSPIGRITKTSWRMAESYFSLKERSRRAIDHITDTLATIPDPTTPEADALRIALGTLLEATT